MLIKLETIRDFTGDLAFRYDYSRNRFSKLAYKLLILLLCKVFNFSCLGITDNAN